MVTFIKPADTLPLRSLVLRNGLDPLQCIFDGDTGAGSFHLGVLEDQTLVSVASFFEVPLAASSGRGYQLRGMATHPAAAGHGHGAALLAFAIQHLQGLDVDYLWCNARASALGFYGKSGFGTVSEEFDIPGIGPHYKMKLNLK